MPTEYKDAIPNFTVRLVGVAPCEWHIEFHQEAKGGTRKVFGIADDREHAAECLRYVIGLLFPSCDISKFSIPDRSEAVFQET